MNPRPNGRWPALLLVALLVAAGPARAQSDPAPPASSTPLRDFCADRPGKVTPPCILDVGHTQLEVGLADAVFQHNQDPHETIYNLAASEFRIGLTPTLEAEIDWTPLIIDETAGASTIAGVGDLTLGFRRALTTPGAHGAAVSIQGYITAPTATNGMGAGGWTGGARLPVSAPLGANLSLGLAPEVDVVRNAMGGGTHLAWSAAAGLSRTFGQTTLEAEVWGYADEDPSGHSFQATADLTAALMVGANTQLDAGANFGLNHDTPGLEVYVGVSRRF